MTEDQRRVARQRLEKQLRQLDSRKFSFNRFSWRKRMAYGFVIAFCVVAPAVTVLCSVLAKVF